MNKNQGAGARSFNMLVKAVERCSKDNVEHGIFCDNCSAKVSCLREWDTKVSNTNKPLSYHRAKGLSLSIIKRRKRKVERGIKKEG